MRLNFKITISSRMISIRVTGRNHVNLKGLAGASAEAAYPRFFDSFSDIEVLKPGLVLFNIIHFALCLNNPYLLKFY